MKVTLVMGSTSNLSQQIAARESFVDNLNERGALLRETRALYAQGRIGIAARLAAA